MNSTTTQTNQQQEKGRSMKTRKKGKGRPLGEGGNIWVTKACWPIPPNILKFAVKLRWSWRPKWPPLNGILDKQSTQQNDPCHAVHHQPYARPSSDYIHRELSWD
jgi:hypothetical protein